MNNQPTTEHTVTNWGGGGGDRRNGEWGHSGDSSGGKTGGKIQREVEKCDNGKILKMISRAKGGVCEQKGKSQKRLCRQGGSVGKRQGREESVSQETK